MRLARLLTVLLAGLLSALLTSPAAVAEPPFRLPTYLTDNAGALDAAGQSEVQQAIDRLYNDKRIRLWVVFVEDFSGQDAQSWAQTTYRRSDLGSQDAILAVATVDRAYALLAPTDAVRGVDVDQIRRDDVEPLLRTGDWAGAAVAAAEGLAGGGSGGGGSVSWVGVLVALAVIGLALLILVLWQRRRRRKRREAEFAAAQRVDPADPAALAAVPLEALDDLSREIVVDVDNEVRTSESELTLAVEEFGERDTEPFTRAVTNARTTLAQALNVRHILDDAVPETPAQRRDLLTRVIVAAAKADRAGSRYTACRRQRACCRPAGSAGRARRSAHHYSGRDGAGRGRDFPVVQSALSGVYDALPEPAYCGRADGYGRVSPPLRHRQRRVGAARRGNPCARAGAGRACGGRCPRPLSRHRRC